MNILTNQSFLNGSNDFLDSSGYGSMTFDRSDYFSSKSFNDHSDCENSASDCENSASDCEIIDLSEKPSANDYKLKVELDLYEIQPSITDNSSENSSKKSRRRLTPPLDIIPEAIEEQVNLIRTIYKNASCKLNNAKDKICNQVQQVQALNRVVLQLDQHSEKLSKLPKLTHLFAKVQGYKMELCSLQYNPSADHIQNVIDLFHTPTNEFAIIDYKSKSTHELLMNTSKLQKNLDRLNELLPIFNQFKEKMTTDFGKRKKTIATLRIQIVEDVISIINGLMAEEFNTTSIFKSSAQLYNFESFRRLLSIIA